MRNFKYNDEIFKVLTLLCQAEVTLKLRKYHFFQNKIECYG